MRFYTDNTVEAVVFHAPPVCKNNCKGCYLISHAARWNAFSPERRVSFSSCWIETVDRLISNKELTKNPSIVRANQIVIAVNTFDYLDWITDQDETLVRPPWMERRILSSYDMWKAFSECRWSPLPDKNYDISIDDYKLSRKELYNAMIEAKDQKFSVINLLWTKGVSEEFKYLAWKHPETKVYTVLHKPLLGQAPSQEQIDLGRKLVRWHKAREIDHNIQMDYCLHHLLADPDTPCRAGINMFNVHPTGVVTGCPYSNRTLATHPRGLSAGSLSDSILKIRDDINSGHLKHDYHYCKLRNVDWTKR